MSERLTERLVLTPVGESDFADLCALTAHPEVGGKLKHGVLTAERRGPSSTATSPHGGERLRCLRAAAARHGAFVGIAGLWDHDAGIGVACVMR